MTVKRYLIIGKETTFGTESVSKDATLDPENINLDPAGDDVIFYEGASGLDRQVEAGQYSTKGDFTFPVDKETIGHFIKLALGKNGYSVTGTASPYTHTFVPAQDPMMDTFTAFVGKDNFEHKFISNAISSMELSVSNGILSAKFATVGQKDAPSGTMQTPTFLDTPIYAAHNTIVTIDGVSANVESLTLTISTGAENAFKLGSRYPYRINRGALSVTADFGLVFDDNTQLQKYWGGANGPQESIIEFPVVINVGSDLDITLPAAVYTSVTQPVSGRGIIKQTAKLRAKLAADGTGPIQFDLTNDKPTY